MLGVRFFFFGCNNSFCGCNISFCGYNISFCGCNNSKSDCYILFSACSKSKRDLCFSYATTYNLVDAFLSFKVLHETDAQRSRARPSAAFWGSIGLSTCCVLLLFSAKIIKISLQLVEINLDK